MKYFANVSEGKAQLVKDMGFIRSIHRLNAEGAAAAMLLVLRELPPEVLVKAREIVREFEEEADVRKKSADEALGL